MAGRRQNKVKMCFNAPIVLEKSSLVSEEIGKIKGVEVTHSSARVNPCDFDFMYLSILGIIL